MKYSNFPRFLGIYLCEHLVILSCWAFFYRYCSWKHRALLVNFCHVMKEGRKFSKKGKSRKSEAGGWYVVLFPWLPQVSLKDPLQFLIIKFSWSRKEEPLPSTFHSWHLLPSIEHEPVHHDSLFVYYSLQTSSFKTKFTWPWANGPIARE